MTDSVTLTHYITSTLLNGREISLGPDDNLLLSGLIDSLGVMQLVKHIQAENDIKIEAGEITLKNFKTVNAIVRFIEQKKSG